MHIPPPSERARTLLQALANRTLIADGAISTMLMDRLGEELAPAESLVITHPVAVAALHRDYIDAGADIITTDTFGASHRWLSRFGLEDRVEAINLTAASIARRAADHAARPVWVAGSIGSSTVREGGTMDDYLLRIRSLLEGGVDMLMFETVCSADEARQGCLAAQQAFEMLGFSVPVIISFYPSDTAGTLLSGHTPEQLIRLTGFIHPVAYGINCVAADERLLAYVPLLQSLPGRIAIMPGTNDGRDIDRFISTMTEINRQAPVAIMGGCCGTTPVHIRALRQLLNSPVKPLV